MAENESQKLDGRQPRARNGSLKIINYCHADSVEVSLLSPQNKPWLHHGRNYIPDTTCRSATHWHHLVQPAQSRSSGAQLGKCLANIQAMRIGNQDPLELNMFTRLTPSLQPHVVHTRFCSATDGLRNPGSIFHARLKWYAHSTYDTHRMTLAHTRSILTVARNFSRKAYTCVCQ